MTNDTPSAPPPAKRCCETMNGDSRYGWLPSHQKRCHRIAKVERNGKPYCGVHDPERLKAIRQKTDRKLERRREDNDRQAALATAREAVVTAAKALEPELGFYLHAARTVRASPPHESLDAKLIGLRDALAKLAALDAGKGVGT